MSKMVEQVARALAKRWSPVPLDKLPPSISEDYFDAARAAIEAMREPDEAMLEAGARLNEQAFFERKGASPTPKDIFQVMIDEALK